jgi:hypothetical protein
MERQWTILGKIESIGIRGKKERRPEEREPIGEGQIEGRPKVGLVRQNIKFKPFNRSHGGPVL